MKVALVRLARSQGGGPRSPVYTASFLIDDQRRLFHAVVHTREADAISFREPEIESLLSTNMDKGRRIYEAISEYHRSGQFAGPLNLGQFDRLHARRRTSRHALATGT
jgi:hypothetical protein